MNKLKTTDPMINDLIKLYADILEGKFNNGPDFPDPAPESKRCTIDGTHYVLTDAGVWEEEIN